MSTSYQNPTKLTASKNRQAFLLTFFDDQNDYEFKEVNGFILEKHLNGLTFEHEVAIYTKEAFARKQAYSENQESLL